MKFSKPIMSSNFDSVRKKDKHKFDKLMKYLKFALVKSKHQMLKEYEIIRAYRFKMDA